MKKNKMKKVDYRTDISYTGNEKETYNLLLKGNPVAEILTGEDGAIEITQKIKNFLSDKTGTKTDVVIQNDGDNLGVIVDLYDDDDCVDSLTIWFDDYTE